ncbi:MAG: SulP family inorganic anion transporter [Chlamydiia bacterium]|nr:SulP family inorganic anion transporter [Chlamydiia bacterium]
MASGGESLSLFPFWRDLLDYQLGGFRRDLVAAISVALLALPQSVAYAFVAGLPPSAGVFSAIFGTIFIAAFGSSRRLVAGPTNAIAILIQSGTAEIIYTSYPNLTGPKKDLFAQEIVLILCLMVGCFQILAAVLKAGRITQFASRSVVVGYLSVVALTILITQCYPFFGIRSDPGHHPLIQRCLFLISNLSLLNIPTTLIAVGSLIFLIGFKKLIPKWPYAVVIFILAGWVVLFFNLSPETAAGSFDVEAGEPVERVTLLGDVGPLFTGFPSLDFPSFNWSLLGNLIPLAFAITLLSVLEATAIGRNYHKASDPPYSSNQEVLGLGIGNLLSSFLGAMPSSGSFSRTALNVSLRAGSRFAAVLSGMILLIFSLLFGFLVAKIPLGTIAALMMLVAFEMINFKNLLFCLRATRIDSLVVIFTFASGLFFNLDIALYIGVILSIVLYLRQAATPLLVEYSFNNIGKLRPIEQEDERLDPRICIVQAEGELFFGAADILEMKLRELSEGESIRIIIFQLFNTRSVDASICLVLKKLHRYMRSEGKVLLASGVNKEVWKVMRSAGLIGEMGEERFFKTNEQLPSEPTRSAYAFAKTLIELDHT